MGAGDNVDRERERRAWESRGKSDRGSGSLWVRRKQRWADSWGESDRGRDWG